MSYNNNGTKTHQQTQDIKNKIKQKHCVVVGMWNKNSSRVRFFMSIKTSCSVETKQHKKQKKRFTCSPALAIQMRAILHGPLGIMTSLFLGVCNYCHMSIPQKEIFAICHSFTTFNFNHQRKLYQCSIVFENV